MLKTLASIASLLAGQGMLLLGNGLFGTLLGVRTRLEGFTTEVTGIVMAGYFVGMLLAAMSAIRVVIAVGHIRAYAAFASIMSVSALLHVLLVEPTVWFVLRVMSGYCMAGMAMVSESWLNERSTNETRGQVLSIYMITTYLGAGVGQFLLVIGAPERFELFSLASILFSFALVPVLLTRAKAPAPVRPGRFSLRQLYKVSPLGVFGCFAAGLANAAFYGLGPVFAQGVGLPLAGVSTFMASVILAGMASQWPVGRISDKMDRRTLLATIAFASVGVAAAIALTAEDSPNLLYWLAALYGGLTFTVYSISVAHANDYVETKHLVQASGGLVMAYGIGASAGPVVASAIMGQIGPAGLFYYTAMIGLVLGGFTMFRMTRRSAMPKEERGRYMPISTAAPTAKTLYASASRDQRDKDIARMSRM